MLKRINIYLNEVFQIWSRLPFSFLLTFISFYFLKLIGHDLETNYVKISVAAITHLLMLLFYRICDEFKDIDTDEKFFPNRPIPSGRVKLSDLKVLLVSITIFCVLINLFYLNSFISFLLFLIFNALMGKWFFLPNLISNNRLLAFITHFPIGLFAQSYILHVLIQEGYQTNLSIFYFIFLINLPAGVWEITRKTRAFKDEEVGYQTYSSMLGRNGSLLFSIFIATFGFVLHLLALTPLNVNSLFYFLSIVLYLGMIFYLLVKAREDKNKSIDLRPKIELFLLGYYLLLISTVYN